MLCLKDFELKRSENTAGAVSCTFIIWLVVMAFLYVFFVPSEATRSTIFRYALYTVIVFVIVIAWIYFNVGSIKTFLFFHTDGDADADVFVYGFILSCLLTFISIVIIFVLVV